jgi:biotin carboxyl carrier protein
MAATYRLTIGESAHDVAVDERDGHFVLTIDGETVEAAFVAGGVGPASLLIGAESFEVAAEEEEDGFEVQVGHEVFDVAVERLIHGHTVSEQAGVAGNQPTQVKAPLTGSIVDVVVAEGDAVSKGQVVVIIESMKMNNELRAPRDGVVAQVHVAKGDRVERNTPLVTIR